MITKYKRKIKLMWKMFLIVPRIILFGYTLLYIQYTPIFQGYAQVNHGRNWIDSFLIRKAVRQAQNDQI